MSRELIFQLLYPLVIILCSIVLGLIFERVVFNKLRALAIKTTWSGDDLFIEALRGSILLWLVIGGIYIAITTFSMPENILSLLERILLAIIIFSVTLVLANIGVGLISLYTKDDDTRLAASSIVQTIVKTIIFIIGILIILQSLGISITPILTALGVGGIAVALALQDTLANLFSGVHIIVLRKVRVGDYIKLDSGEEGYVTDITWRNTTIVTILNNMIIIPNSTIASSILRNYYFPQKEMQVPLDVGVSYDSDLGEVEKVTLEVAKDVMEEFQGEIPGFEPFLYYHTFDNSSINFTVRLPIKEFSDQYMIKHVFIKRLHKRYNKEGIDIPFPIRTVFMNQ